MAFTGKSLADGQVATTWGTIFAPSGVKAMIKSADFFNGNVTTQTLEVAITRSGSSRRQIARVSLAQNELLRLITDGDLLQLSSGDVLEAQTTTAAAVDYTLTGADE